MAKFIASVVLAVLALVALSAAGCKSGGEKADDTSREISEAELSQMVLGLDLFGTEYAGFTAEEPTGPLTIEQTAEEEDDPAAERADLEQFGWVASQKAAFEGEWAEGQAAGLGSMVYAFETSEGAAGYMDDSEGEFRELSSEDGITRIDISEHDLSDEAISLLIEGEEDMEDGSKLEVSGWAMAFRRGRLVGVVHIFALNADDLEKTRLEGKVEVLADLMNKQMESVLAAGNAAARAQ
jgi:hypothetical protein